MHRHTCRWRPLTPYPWVNRRSWSGGKGKNMNRRKATRPKGRGGGLYRRKAARCHYGPKPRGVLLLLLQDVVDVAASADAAADKSLLYPKSFLLLLPSTIFFAPSPSQIPPSLTPRLFSRIFLERKKKPFHSEFSFIL